ncbi:hypothetical protein [Streptomyces sp. 35G-GA-8]|uniref:LexA family protein n=1 Tax=Streptomyces sp. 35G-GA-8 TaxID=2939434 RepID=UPI00201F9EDA|nr:hypothetical protein [Streptomyces sp. 35G-GA-8]MCL7382442.1 hypothetical protein [Streptomyces sp. 35G-GA-8]
MPRPGAHGRTERQLQILRAIRIWITDHGEGPSVRQIGQESGFPVLDRLPTSSPGWRSGD